MFAVKIESAGLFEGQDVSSFTRWLSEIDYVAEFNASKDGFIVERNDFPKCEQNIELRGGCVVFCMIQFE